ncbi:MAG: glycoside hydrolase 43 family protein [Lachnospiraceae bacterium]|nr:glycoside hydrolase 43 family protein [Lachnospiraceae bacterium]
MIKGHNPILGMDFPDPDVIRIDDTYYMVTTTMHMMPGCEILQSHDLINWEHLTYVFDRLDSTSAQKLTGEENIFGKGMWAATLRFHEGIFYILFVANDTQKTYLYRAKEITGPWKKSEVEGFYHDASLLFDDDGKIYIVYGNTDIYLTELKSDLTGLEENGLHRLIISDKGNKMLGFEGSHLYKINGLYYLFLIHSASDKWMRREACFIADSLTGEFKGGDVLSDDLGRFPMGAAQGGIVDDGKGNYNAVVFQDCGAIGRIPVVVPVTWEGEKPVFGIDGKVPIEFELPSLKEGAEYAPLFGSDDFKKNYFKEENKDKKNFGCFGLKSFWQFSHEPDLSLVDVDKKKGILKIKTDKICTNIHQAGNVLTQRTKASDCAASVTLDAANLNEGDSCGLSIYQGNYIWVGITKKDGKLFATVTTFTSKENTWIVSKDQGEEIISKEIEGTSLRVKISAHFDKNRDYAYASILNNEGKWEEFGEKHELSFRLDYFMGARFGLFVYSTKECGGEAEFSEFTYEV